MRLSAADPELERLNTLAFGTRTTASERETGWQADLALWRRSECEHSSLAKDAAATADGVGKSLTAAAVVREHSGTGAEALVGLEFRPIPIGTASGSGREATSDQ